MKLILNVKGLWENKYVDLLKLQSYYFSGIDITSEKCITIVKCCLWISSNDFEEQRKNILKI